MNHEDLTAQLEKEGVPSENNARTAARLQEQPLLGGPVLEQLKEAIGAPAPNIQKQFNNNRKGITDDPVPDNDPIIKPDFSP